MASSVRPLQKDDDRTSFRSGDADLDHFFHRYAGQNQFRHRAGVTYVYEHEARIVAYMTVTAWTMESDVLAVVEGRKFPPYPLPALNIARLATAEGERGRGYGSALVAYACAMAFKMSREMGCVGISTDAKRDAADYYVARGFVFFDTVEDHGAPPDAEKEMFLSLRKIETALGE